MTLREEETLLAAKNGNAPTIVPSMYERLLLFCVCSVVFLFCFYYCYDADSHGYQYQQIYTKSVGHTYFCCSLTTVVCHENGLCQLVHLDCWTHSTLDKIGQYAMYARRNTLTAYIP